MDIEIPTGSLDQTYKSDIERMQAKYPHAVFAYVSLAPRSNLPPLDKQKYMVPKNTTVGQFLYILRKRFRLPSDKALFIFVNNTLPASSQTMNEVYQHHKSPDGILRITCTSESVFG